MATQELKLILTKSTKGTHVYGTSEDEAPIPSVYIKRAALPSPPPASIVLTLRYADE